MTKEVDGLRQRAERALEQRKARVVRAAEDEDVLGLLHELEVHQVELEMQNDELRAARVQVEAGLARYTEIFEFAPIGYTVLSGDGIIQEINFAGARLLGAERRRLAGKRLGLFVSGRDQGRFAEFQLKALTMHADEGDAASCQVTIEPDGQSPRVARMTARLLEDRSIALLVAMEDLTERARAERTLREESLHRDEFLAALSHELRNPLAPIRNSLYLLERGEPGSEVSRRSLAVLDRQVAHLALIVDDLLDTTRIARGKIELHLQPLDLAQLVRQTVEDQRRTFEMVGVDLAVRVPALDAIWIDADPTRLAQALGNLLGNAAKFTNRGGHVEVALRRDGASAVLSVRDDGVGISDEVRAHLFEPFRQAPQTIERTRGGLGLGLALVRGLVELHGGSVHVTSAGEGTGATFTVRLPVLTGPASRPPARARPPVRRCRVLIIEDSVDAAESLRDLLALEGHDVVVAFDGAEGLSRARAHRPEVVLCDIGLPGISGYEVARTLRQDASFADTVLVALSGYALPDDVQRAKQAGFDRHIAKPPKPEELERLMADACAAPARPGG
jgi:two-component system CheB/CheR fusion protein